MARTSVTIVLELDETTDSPVGRARVPGGPSREFHGWIGLAEAIDSLARTPEGVGQPEPTHERETP
jgi:hypothetical protein